MKHFKRGTPEFGILCGALLALCGLLIMRLGFWRTLLLAALFAVGYFLGGVQDKSGFVKSTVDKVVPDRKDQTINFRQAVEKDQQEALRGMEQPAGTTAQEDEE